MRPTLRILEGCNFRSSYFGFQRMFGGPGWQIQSPLSTERLVLLYSLTEDRVEARHLSSCGLDIPSNGCVCRRYELVLCRFKMTKIG